MLIELGDPRGLGDAVQLGDPMVFCDLIGLGKSNVRSLLDVRAGSSASFPSFVFDLWQFKLQFYHDLCYVNHFHFLFYLIGTFGFQERLNDSRKDW